MMTAKVFKCGNSQAFRLPKEYRLDTAEVSVNRIGNVIHDPQRGSLEGFLRGDSRDWQ